MPNKIYSFLLLIGNMSIFTPLFLTELIVVGIAFAMLYNLVAFFIPETNPYHYILAPFIAGVVGHFAFEITGVNQYYADYKAKEGK